MAGTRKPKKVDPFYSDSRWHRARTQTLIRDKYTCVNCGRNVRPKGQSRVDHIMPRRKFPELAYHLPNLRTLCVACDNARHARDRAAGREEATEVGADGFPVGSDWSA